MKHRAELRRTARALNISRAIKVVTEAHAGGHISEHAYDVLMGAIIAEIDAVSALVER